MSHRGESMTPKATKMEIFVEFFSLTELFRVDFFM